jgi:hypothetical protein
MALELLETNIVLDVYDHDGTRPSMKSIALDDNTRYVFARLTYQGNTYDIGSTATVKLVVIRPDKVGAQVAGEAKEIQMGQEDESIVSIYGAYAELDQPAIAVAGTLLGQFIITSGDQILRSQIFSINNGEALDADEWAGQYDGYNLDELVEKVDAAVDKVDGMEADVTDLKSLHVETETPINLWIQGTISLDTGEALSSKYRCRSYGYYTARDLGYGTAKITIKSGLRLMGVAWDEKMGYAGSISDDWVTGELTFEVREGWSYRFIASKPSGSGNFTPSECVDAFFIVKSGMTDDTLSVSGKSADARAVKESLMPSTSSFNGNTSTIVAAKYFSYADGTQPVVDWYLLADYAGYIYISKDLKSKKYICKLPYWFQYKFAVRQNGDIIAVYRTELLSAASGATYDSSLDDCRKNPLVCLHSEGYAEWHEVDFGTSLKPTGWLENCGIEVLPNGDIIFGEYTRMMVVYTANLWRIKAGADITNSASWEIIKTYRVAQNDTDTYGETVIEHFHTVQTDPYTGTVYYATGDTGNKSQIWYSTDSGDNWTQQTFVDPDTSQTVTSGEKFFRLLNFNFTADKVYWSSDSSTEHAILKADRNGINGLTPNSIRVVTEIATATGKPATYGSVLYEDKKIMILMERCDSNATQMLFRAYDLVTNTLKTICTIKCAVSEAKNIGFRTEYTEFEPLDGIIKCGFGTHRYYINYNAICGNKGTEFINNVNTLNIRISMDAERNIYAKFGTYYI